ncbi:hypothetical protein CCHOA_06595 [Corynebacterium choanae]|uniref:CopC domain-containing protein n=1 Tax=Corynebacterium choanae TaxID=1862358 RepID=A0A3G6JA01_9CORY|nr:hypothetical protein CCHOA_06595 [Corynebacterium choanae]
MFSLESIGTGFRRNVAVVATAGLLGVGAAPLAFAHDVVVHATPADGAVVETFPHHIELEFSGIPQESFNTIAVSNAETHEVLFTDTPQLTDNVVSVDLPDDLNPGSGEYIVGFQITSSDGHATRGKTTFHVAGEGADSPTTRSSAASTSATSTSSSTTTTASSAAPASSATTSVSTTATASTSAAASSTTTAAADTADDAPTNEQSAKGSPVPLWIGLGVGVIVLIGLVVLFTRRRRTG